MLEYDFCGTRENPYLPSSELHICYCTAIDYVLSTLLLSRVILLIIILQLNLELYFLLNDHQYVIIELYLTNRFVSFVRHVSKIKKKLFDFKTRKSLPDQINMSLIDQYAMMTMVESIFFG
jgi:hypothetical protein